MDAETKDVVINSLRKNRFTRVLSGPSLEAIVMQMELFEFQKDDYVMKQDEPGNYFFVADSGLFEVTVNGKVVDEDMGRGSTFGGIALLYNSTRTASVRAKEASGAWGVNGSIFRHELREHARKHYQENRRVIDQVSMFDGLPAVRKEQVGKIGLFTEIYEAGRVVIREGFQSPAIYVVREGRLSFNTADGHKTDIGSGESFGWRSVLYEKPETATVIVEEKSELVSIGVKQLKKVLGDDLAACLMHSFAFSVLRKDDAFAKLPHLHLQKISAKVQTRVYSPGAAVESNLLLAIVMDGEVSGSRRGKSGSYTRGQICENELLEGEESGDKAETDKPIGELVAGKDGCRLALLDAEGLISALDELGLPVSTETQALSYVRRALLVQKVPVFRELSDNQIHGVIESMTLRRFPPKSVVFKQGDVGEALFIIASGKVRVSIDGKFIRDLGKGACFGERALVFEEKRSATIEVMDEPVELWTIDKQAFRHAISETMRDNLKRSLDLQGTNVSLKGLKHVRLIGKGSFGTVRMVEHKRTALRYALKRIKKEGGKVPPEVTRECELLAENCHPFLLQYVDTFETESSIYILTELITGGQLYQQVVQRMGVLSRKHAQFYIGSLALILESLHERHIVYRDLKPENVMLDHQGYLKLVDFGLAKRLDDSSPRTYTLAGTAMYMAPEVIQGHGYGTECDIWSLGVIFFEFVCGQLPFGEFAEDTPAVFNEILENPLQFPGRYNDAAGKKMLQGMLCKESDQRLGTGANGWEDIKGHKYFKQGVTGNIFSSITGRDLPAPFVPEKEEYSDESEIKEIGATLSDAEELGKEDPMDFGCKLLQIFRTFDMNGDEKIDRRELGAVLRTLDPKTFSDAVCDQLMKSLDADNDGSISYDEFLNWILNEEVAGELQQMLRSATKLDAHG